MVFHLLSNLALIANLSLALLFLFLTFVFNILSLFFLIFRCLFSTPNVNPSLTSLPSHLFPLQVSLIIRSIITSFSPTPPAAPFSSGYPFILFCLPGARLELYHEPGVSGTALQLPLKPGNSFVYFLWV